ncbi:tetratricopeptide repeat protein [Arthrobacter globiformis]|uniref:tetratricopeptide repeat protein n=1 Tax=Arthrobacter globiformis TaxID=1665 RepID=UPI0039795AA6
MSDYNYDLGLYNRAVTTSSPEAQLWFDRGLLWAYSFNHEEAIRCFEKALDSDPGCALAYWGIAFAKGPNYNKAWRLFDRVDLEESIPYIRSVIRSAHNAAADATPVERALIEALTARFPVDGVPSDPAEYRKLDLAYADAMRPVYHAHPHDLDVAALFADALLCVRPRGLWDLDSGEPTSPGTDEARGVLEAAMAQPGGDGHPALAHLYIHLMEMSPYPEIAIPAADRLRTLVPDGSHMSHMVTHIDAACGDWRRVIDTSQDAVAADEKFFGRESRVLWYRMYRAHNLHNLAYAGMISGRYEVALSAAQRLEEIITPELLQVTTPPLADIGEHFRTILPHVLIRFGRWQEILELELPGDQELFCSTTAMILYAQSIANAVLGRIPEAEKARDRFLEVSVSVPESRLNTVPVKEIDLLKVAAAVLDGELEYRKGNFNHAFTSLRRAIELEDALPYADPPAWLMPARHAYGALLLEQGRYEEAETVYRDDLGLAGTLARRRVRPNNVWSLQGLYECLTVLGKDDEAKKIVLQRDIALAAADIDVSVSCFCRLSPASQQGEPGCCSTDGPQDIQTDAQQSCC